MGGFPLSRWFIMVVPPVLMILSVVIWYFREVKREKMEDELIGKIKTKG